MFPPSGMFQPDGDVPLAERIEVVERKLEQIRAYVGELEEEGAEVEASEFAIVADALELALNHYRMLHNRGQILGGFTVLDRTPNPAVEALTARLADAMDAVAEHAGRPNELRAAIERAYAERNGRRAVELEAELETAQAELEELQALRDQLTEQLAEARANANTRGDGAGPSWYLDFMRADAQRQLDEARNELQSMERRAAEMRGAIERAYNERNAQSALALEAELDEVTAALQEQRQRVAELAGALQGNTWRRDVPPPANWPGGGRPTQLDEETQEHLEALLQERADLQRRQDEATARLREAADAGREGAAAELQQTLEDLREQQEQLSEHIRELLAAAGAARGANDTRPDQPADDASGSSFGGRNRQTQLGQEYAALSDRVETLETDMESLVREMTAAQAEGDDAAVTRLGRRFESLSASYDGLAWQLAELEERMHQADRPGAAPADAAERLLGLLRQHEQLSDDAAELEARIDQLNTLAEQANERGEADVRGELRTLRDAAREALATVQAQRDEIAAQIERLRAPARGAEQADPAGR